MNESYYADTSSVRAAGGSLASLLESGRLRTSVLVAIELFNGMTDSEDAFRKRRAGLRTLKREIDFRMPEQIIFSGFQALVDEFDFIENRTRSLEIILNALDQADTLADFRHALDAATLNFPLDYFASYDQKFESVFGRIVEIEAREVRCLFEDANAPKFDPTRTIPSEVLSGGLASFCDWLLADGNSLNESLTQMSLATVAASLVIEPPSDELIHRAYNSYNGIGYTYLKALSMKSTDLMRSNTHGQRNDGMDVAHFLYLHEGEVLVSEDLAQRELAERIGVSAITFNELRGSLS
ncbi:MAG: hypothetical protein WD425_09615 [Nitrospirales bacterium]